MGFLRQLNEIDATFKHAYLENPDFDFKDMQVTVNQIRNAMSQTLARGAYYLQPLKNQPAERVD